MSTKYSKSAKMPIHYDISLNQLLEKAKKSGKLNSIMKGQPKIEINVTRIKE